MTSVFLVRDEQVLLLYRMGSRAVPDSWVGVGGHLEPSEIADPTGAALRELYEEIGVGADQISDLALRYVALRDSASELRQIFYFTATLRPEVPSPTECAEGELRWFDLSMDPSTLEMPASAQVVFSHWLASGRRDEDLRFLVINATGEVTGPF